MNVRPFSASFNPPTKFLSVSAPAWFGVVFATVFFGLFVR